MPNSHPTSSHNQIIFPSMKATLPYKIYSQFYLNQKYAYIPEIQIYLIRVNVELKYHITI